MGNVLCCLSARENPDDSSKKTPPIKMGKKEELTIKKSKNKPAKKNTDSKSMVSEDTNLSNDDNKEEKNDKDCNNLDELTNEIQEQMFEQKPRNEREKKKIQVESESANKIPLGQDKSQRSSDNIIKSRPNLQNKPKKEIKETDKKTEKKDIFDEYKVQEDTENSRTNSNIRQMTTENTTTRYESPRKSIIGGPLKLKNFKKQVEYLNIELYIDHLDLNSLDTEVYGPHFQPYLDIRFNNEKSKLISFGSDMDTSRNESMNISGLSEISVSNTSNNSFILNTSKLGNVYHYKALRKFTIAKKRLENYEVNLEFSLKNSCKFKNIGNNKDSSFNFGNVQSNSNLNVSASSNNLNNSTILNTSVVNSDNIPIILIGSGYINLNKFYCENSKKYHDLYLELKLRKSQSIGYLKLIIFIEELEKINALNLMGETQIDEDGPLSEFGLWLEKFKEDSENPHGKVINFDNINLWENNYVNNFDLPDMICEDFFNVNFSFLHDKAEKGEKGEKNENNGSFLESNSQTDSKIIGINKINYLAKKENEKNNKKSEKNKNKKTNEKDIIFKTVERIKIVDNLVKSKMTTLSNDLKTKGKMIDLQEIELKEIFLEEIKSKITFNENGLMKIKENEQGYDLSKYYIYQFMLILSNLSIFEKMEILSKFFDLLNNEEKSILFQITNLDKYNLFLFRMYLILFSNYVLYFKNNTVENMRYRLNIDQRIIIKSVFSILENIKEIEINHKELWHRYVFEIKDCLILALNLVWDLCHETLENPRKDKKEANEGTKNKAKMGEMTNIYKNCLHTLTYRNRLIFLLKPFLNHSEIIGIVIKILRKCFQNMNNSNLCSSVDFSQFTEFPEKIMEGIVESLIEGDNKNSFIKTIEVVMLKYTHYPEIIRNSYQILLSLLKKTNESLLGKFLGFFDFKKFQCSFEIYKFKMRTSSKEINFLFISILYICITFFQKKSVKDKLIDDERENIKPDNIFREKFFKILEQLNNIFCGFFDITHRRYIDFVKKKFLDLNFQDILLRIGSIMMLYESNAENMINSDFMNNLIRYLLEFSYGKCEFKPHASRLEKQMFNYISHVNEKKIKNLELVKRLSSTVILSALEIYKNLLDHDSKYFSAVAGNLVKYGINESDNLIEILNDALEPLDRHKVSLINHKGVLKAIVDSFDNQDEEEEEEEDDEVDAEN